MSALSAFDPSRGAGHIAPAESVPPEAEVAMRPPRGIPDPAEVEVPADLREHVEELMSRYPERRSAAIPALWAIQRRDGWCTPEGILQVAAVMGVTPGYLEGVASFYDLLRTEPLGTDRVLVCTNISCWLRGADELLEAFCAAVGIDGEKAAHGGASSADGRTFVSGFECLGACDIAPMASVNERYYGPLDDGDAERVIAQLRDGAEVLPEKAIAKRPAAGADLAESPPAQTEPETERAQEEAEGSAERAEETETSEPESPAERERESDR